MTTEAPERIWAFYAPEIEEDNPKCTIVAGEHCMHGAQEYIRADIAEAQLAAARQVRPFTPDDLEKIRNVLGFFVHHPLHQDRETAMKRRANEILSALSEQEGK